MVGFFILFKCWCNLLTNSNEFPPGRYPHRPERKTTFADNCPNQRLLFNFICTGTIN